MTAKSFPANMTALKKSGAMIALVAGSWVSIKVPHLAGYPNQRLSLGSDSLWRLPYTSSTSLPNSDGDTASGLPAAAPLRSRADRGSIS
jgi:hypothetical protein